MNNVLPFFNKKDPNNNVLAFAKSKNHITEVGQEMTQEEYECYEDMIGLSDVASPEEVFTECDDGFCITHDFSVKVSPSNKDFHTYVTSKNNQKIKKSKTSKFQVIKGDK